MNQDDCQDDARMARMMARRIAKEQDDDTNLHESSMGTNKNNKQTRFDLLQPYHPASRMIGP